MIRRLNESASRDPVGVRHPVRNSVWRRFSAGIAPVLVRRRAKRDAALLAVWTLTVAFASVLALAGPVQISRMVDAGAREAVDAAGAEADLVVSTPVADPDRALQLATVRPVDIVEVAGETEELLPNALARTRSATTVAVSGLAAAGVAPTDVQPALDDPASSLRLSIGMLTEQNSAALELLAGDLPTASTTGDTDAAPPDSSAPMEVLVSAAGATASSLDVGSVISLPSIDTETDLPARVVGIVGERRVGSGRFSPWRDLREVWDPSTVVDSGTRSIGVTVLAQPDAVARAARSLGRPFTGEVRFSFDPEAFTGDILTAAAEDSRRLSANSAPLVAGSGYNFSVESGLPEAVSDFPGRVRASLAQMSIVIAGVVGAASVVLLLVSRLLVYRRLADVLLERARGASLVSIAVRTLVEAVIAVAVALLIAVGLTRAIGVVSVDDTRPVQVVLGVALVAGVAQTLVAVRAHSTVRSVGVNRLDLIRARRRGRIARLAIEAAVLLLASAALLALVDRGLLQQRSAGVDPLIAAAPLLLAAAVTVLVLRVSRWPAMAVARIARRSRGISGLVVSSRVLRALAIAPLIALTIAIALVVGTGSIAQIVRDGQTDASWQRVGADVRVEQPGDAEGIEAEDVARVASAPGVAAASGLSVQSQVPLALGTSSATVTLLAIDRDYPDLVASLPDIDGVTDASEAGLFSQLSDEVGDDAPLPAIVDASIAERLIADDITIAIGDTDVPLRVIGTVGSGPDGYVDDGVVYLDLTSLSARLPTPPTADTLLAIGPGSAAAVERLEPAASDVLTRTGWLDDRRGLALVEGVRQAVIVGTGALILLTLIAIVCTAVAGSSERARSLALLRTLGARPRIGIPLSVVDQVPLMIASMAGGVLAGTGIAVLLTPALGLPFLTGGLTDPVPFVPIPFLLEVLAGVVAVFAVGTLIEVLLRRRDRVSDAIRVGETV